MSNNILLDHEYCIQNPLEDNIIFEDQSPRINYDILTPFFGDYKINWGKEINHPETKNINRVKSVKLINISFFEISATASNTISFHNLKKRNFITFLIPLNGQTCIDVDNHYLNLKKMGASIISAEKKYIIERPKFGRHLAIQIPISLLDCLSAKVFQWKIVKATTLKGGYILDISQTTNLMHYLNQSFMVINRPKDDPFQEKWIQQTEEGLTLLALEILTDITFRSDKKIITKPSQSRSIDTLQRLEEYIINHLEYPLTTHDLLEYSNISRTQLFSICQRHLNISPMEWVKQLRLNAAKEHLIKNPEEKINYIAYRYGFGHPGRFAKYFRNQFGILPHEVKSEII